MIKPLSANTDYFTLSEEDALAFSGLAVIRSISDILAGQDVGAVAMTLGAEGVIYRDQAVQRIDNPAYDKDFVRTCGRGDCFSAGFATLLHLGGPLEECLRFGQASEARNVAGLHSQAGIENLETAVSSMEGTPARRQACRERC